MNSIKELKKFNSLISLIKAKLVSWMFELRAEMNSGTEKIKNECIMNSEFESAQQARKDKCSLMKSRTECANYAEWMTGAPASWLMNSGIK